MKSTKRVVMVLAIGLNLGSVGLVLGSADRDDDHLEARRLMESGSIQPLETILEQVLSQRPGRILEVELEGEDGRNVYEIELLDESGQVWELKLDAVTGEILDQEKEN